MMFHVKHRRLDTLPGTPPRSRDIFLSVDNYGDGTCTPVDNQLHVVDNREHNEELSLWHPRARTPCRIAS